MAETTQHSSFAHDLQDFLTDRRSRNLSVKTIRWYKDSLAIFEVYALNHKVAQTTDVSPNLLRQFLIHLADKGHNPGGVRNIFITVRAFINWHLEEYKPNGWEPLKNVRLPKQTIEPLTPLSVADFKKLIATCNARTLTGDRDRALLLVLFDSGVRKQELINLKVSDVEMNTGQILIRVGKGRKARVTFIGQKTQRALRQYLRHRNDLKNDDPLWIERKGKKLTPSGLREIIRRRAKKAGIPAPGLHDFRRAFALNALRSGMDVVTLQRLLGHSSLAIINRYLAQTGEDLREQHQKTSPVDNLLD
ncbi:MAG: tyrosine-type recombinase/integrase [Caldilineaceae bacterium]